MAEKYPLLQNSRQVQITDDSGNPAIFDEDGALVIVDYPHHEVHEGITFVSSWKSPEGSDVSDNASFGFMMRVMGLVAHTTFEFAGGGDLEIRLWEDATFSASGTVHPIYNLNRMSPTNPTVVIRQGPTLVTGTLIENFLEPGGTGPATSSGGTARRSTEWNLRTGTVYYLQGINRGGSAQPGSIIDQWYEEEPR